MLAASWLSGIQISLEENEMDELLDAVRKMSPALAAHDAMMRKMLIAFAFSGNERLWEVFVTLSSVNSLLGDSKDQLVRYIHGLDINTPKYEMMREIREQLIAEAMDTLDEINGGGNEG